MIMGICSGTSTEWLYSSTEENVGFRGEGKTGVPGEKPLGAGNRTNLTNSTHILCRVREKYAIDKIL